MPTITPRDLLAYRPILERVPAAEPARIVLPYPPSANTIWRTVLIGKFPRVLLSEKGRAYFKTAGAIVAASGQRIMAGPIIVHLWLYRPKKIGDLDNYISSVFDAVNGTGWRDDSQVVEIHAYRLDCPSNPRVEILFARAKGFEPLFEGAK